MIVLKIIGWVLLGILALIVLALCVKLQITAEYSEENTHVMLQWLFLKIPLYPKKPKPPKPEKEQPAEETNEEEQPVEEQPEEEKPAAASAPQRHGKKKKKHGKN